MTELSSSPSSSAPPPSRPLTLAEYRLRDISERETDARHPLPSTSAMPSARLETRSTSQTSNGNGNMSVVRESVMAPEGDHGALPSQDCKLAQPLAKCGPRGPWEPVTDEQGDALELLQTVPVPLSPASVSRLVGWSLGRATRWVRFFAAKGLLLATGKGHVWRETERAGKSA